MAQTVAVANFKQWQIRIMAGVMLLFFIIYGVWKMVRVYQLGCPYGSYDRCEWMNMQYCGNPDIFNESQCPLFVEAIEPCYCSHCFLCLDKERANHCQLSTTQRLQMCRDYFRSIK